MYCCNSAQYIASAVMVQERRRQSQSWQSHCQDVVLVAALALVAATPTLRAQEQTAGKETLPVATETTETENPDKEVAPDAGTGNFTRSPFHISVSVREGYDDNVYTTDKDKVGSFFTNGQVVIDYKFGNDRTRLDLQGWGGATYYYHRPFGQEYDIDTGVTFSVTHQATPRLGLGAAAYLTYRSEPDFNTGIGINRRSGNYFYTNDKFSVTYQWSPRFATATSYTLGVIDYDNSAISTYEDRFEHTFGNEFRYLALPTTTLVGEYRYQIVDYDTAPNDSTTHFALAGLDHSFNPHFNISLRGGVQFRDFENFDEQTSPYGEATLNYSLGERTTLSWANRYGLDEPDVPGTASRTTFRTGLNATHAFTPRIVGSLSFFYQHDDNDSLLTPTSFVPAFDEDSLDISLGVRYEINRNWAALAGYSHTEVFSDITLREYARNRYYLGVNASF